MSPADACVRPASSCRPGGPLSPAAARPAGPVAPPPPSHSLSRRRRLNAGSARRLGRSRCSSQGRRWRHRPPGGRGPCGRRASGRGRPRTERWARASERETGQPAGERRRGAHAGLGASCALSRGRAKQRVDEEGHRRSERALWDSHNAEWWSSVPIQVGQHSNSEPFTQTAPLSQLRRPSKANHSMRESGYLRELTLLWSLFPKLQI